MFLYTILYSINNSDKSIYTNGDSSVTITANATVTFNNNTARWYGGVPYSNKYGYSNIAFDSNAQLLVVIQKHYSFVYNKAVFVMLLTMYWIVSLVIPTLTYQLMLYCLQSLQK